MAATETVAPQAPQRNPARLARILRAHGKDKPEARPWRAAIAPDAKASSYTMDDVGVSADFINGLVANLTEAECARATQGLRPLSDQEQEMAARAARFGKAFGVDAPTAGKKSAAASAVIPVAGAAAVDPLQAALRRARFGTLPKEEPKKQPQQQQKQQKQQKQEKGKKAGKDQKPSAGKQQQNKDKKRNDEKKNKEGAVSKAPILLAPLDDATKAQMAARAARFGKPTAPAPAATGSA